MQRLIIAILYLVCLLSFNSYAAGPITHAVLAEKYLSLQGKVLGEDEKKLFMLGNIFPDIRYLGVIKREQSHYKGITLKKVRVTSDVFQQGMYLHSFVDEQRHHYIRKIGIQKKLTEIPSHQRDIFLKIVEDQILHDQYNWANMRTYLTTIPEDEKKYGIDMQALTQWHAGLTVYFTTPPSFILTQISLFDQGILSLDPNTVKRWSELIPKYVQDPSIKEYVTNLIKHFEQLFSSQK